MLKCLNAQVIKQDNVSETIIILKRNKVSTTMQKLKADYYSNLFDEVNTAAAYWRLLEKTSGTTKVNRQAHRWEPYHRRHRKGNFILNDYFCTVAEKLIGPADEIQPLHAHSRQNLDIPTTTSITISQMEIEEKICKLKVMKAAGPDDVSARHLKYAGMSIAPSLSSLF